MRAWSAARRSRERAAGGGFPPCSSRRQQRLGSWSRPGSWSRCARSSRRRSVRTRSRVFGSLFASAICALARRPSPSHHSFRPHAHPSPARRSRARSPADPSTQEVRRHKAQARSEWRAAEAERREAERRSPAAGVLGACCRALGACCRSLTRAFARCLPPALQPPPPPPPLRPPTTHQQPPLSHPPQPPPVARSRTPQSPPARAAPPLSRELKLEDRARFSPSCVVGHCAVRIPRDSAGRKKGAAVCRDREGMGWTCRMSAFSVPASCVFCSFCVHTA